ncbi:MAG: Acetyltransferase (GNAT) family protein [Firmicutes bacterium ADurb.BinA205]|nr:MAG: Acetyltransferase (GNAT) family protein [Firmicutes bacterium ADurb.BinA205]
MIDFIEKKPSAQEYSSLTEAVGWGREPDGIVEEMFENTLYSVCAYDGEKIIGFARIVGDGMLFAYIQDVMVLPEYQGRHIGSVLMEYIMGEISRRTAISPNIRTYLGASEGKEDFYRRFGFVTREELGLGAGMILKKRLH